MFEDSGVLLQRRHCSICGESESTLVFDQPMKSIIGLQDMDYHHLINACSTCGFIYASPIPKDQFIQQYYEQMSNYEHPESSGIKPAAEMRQIDRQLEIIAGGFATGFTGRALEVGCSIALGLSRLKEVGWNVLGLDPSEKCIEISRTRLGVEVRKGFLSLHLLQDKAPFDLIILSHVLEHLVDPAWAMKVLHELLAESGLIFIEVPNMLGLHRTKCAFTFEHVNYFTPTSLTNLVQQGGFAVDRLHVFDNGKDINPDHSVLALTVRKTNQSFAIRDDGQEGLRAVKDYKRTTGKLLAAMNERISHILDHTPAGRLALWGAGIHTSQLLSETLLKDASIACIYDNDPKKFGKRLFGIRIEGFPQTVAEAAKDIDAILISSEGSENEIYHQLKAAEQQGIKVYRLYAGLFVRPTAE